MERGTGRQIQRLVPASWISPAWARMCPWTTQHFQLKITWRVVNIWMSIEDDGGAAPSITRRSVVDQVVIELPPLDYHLFVLDYFGCERLLRQALVAMEVHPVLHAAVIRRITAHIWRVRPAVSRMPPGTIFEVHTRFALVTLHPAASENLAEGDDQYEIFDFQEEEQPTGMIPATDASIKALGRVKVLENDEYSCPICLEELVGGCEATVMPCSHLFHHACITTWLEKSHLCPVCRFQMPPVVRET